MPYYWLIWPEARTLAAHALRDGEWRVVMTLTAADQAVGRGRARIPSFDAIELDLADLLGTAGQDLRP